MNKSKILLTCFLWIGMIWVAMGQRLPEHRHHSEKACLNCRTMETDSSIVREEIRALNVHGKKSPQPRTRAARAIPPDDFEYVIPVVFHVFGTEFNEGTTVTVDLIRKALEETNKDFWGLQPEWNTIPAAREPFKCPMKITFRLAEKDPDGNPTTGVTFHEYETGFGNGGGYNERIQKYAWDNYRYMNIYIMWDLYDDSDYVQSGVSWYPDVDMSNANLARVVYNGSYLGENAAITNNNGNFRCVLTHEFGHFFNLKHTFEGCDYSITYPNDEVDDTPAHIKDPSLQEGTKNPFGEVIDVANFMNYPRMYKNFTKGQVDRMKAALQHEARYTLWQKETHEKVFYSGPAPRLEISESTIHEDVKNDGSFTAVYKIWARDCHLKTDVGEYVPAEDYTVGNLPAGITLKLKAVAEDRLEGELTGKFAAHETTDNGTFSVTLKNSLLTEGKILNPSFKLFYTFRDAYTIVHGDAGGITASPGHNWTYFTLGLDQAAYGAWYANDGRIIDCYKLQSYKKPLVAYSGTMNIKPLPLATEIGVNSDWETPQDEYAGVFDLKSPEYTEWVGQNAYIGIQFEVNHEILYGWLNVSFNPAGDGYTIHDWAYNTEPGASIKAGQTKDGIPEKIMLSPAEISEAVANDGSVTDKITIQIVGINSEFVKGGVLTPGTDYTITGIPDGLSAKVSLLDKTKGEIGFSGKASKHAKADKATIELELAANLVNNPNTGGLKNKIELKFIDPYGIFYNDIDDIWIAANGSWTEFSFGIGNADFELWFAERLGNRFKFVSANNPLVAYEGTSDIVPLEFGETVGKTLTDGMAWKQQKSGVPQPEIDESMLDLKSDSFLEWVGKTAYVGVQFQNNGLTHYGWIGIRFEADGKMMTMEDWAYNEAPGEPIQAGYKVKNQGPYLAWSDTILYESALNDGSLDSLSVKVKGTSFVAAVGQKLKAGTDYSADALPEGLSLTIEVKDAQTVELQFNGKAVAHAAADSVKNWKLEFKDAAFAVAPVSDPAKSFHIYYKDPFHIVYTDIDDIPCNPTDNFKVFYPVEGNKDINYGVWYNEGALRLEAYGKHIICTNTGQSSAYVKPLSKGYLITEDDVWNTGGDYPDEHWIWGPAYKDWAGKEAYLGFAFQLNDGFHYGWMRLEVAADGSAYVLKDYAYHSGPEIPIRAGDKGIDEPAFLVINNTVFHEGMDNDGAVADSVQIDIVGGTYNKTSGSLTEGTDYTVEGLSEGLTLKTKILAGDKLLLKLEGKATAHDQATSVRNLKFIFQDAAFAAGTDLKAKTVKLNIDYLDPYRIVYVDFKDISCSRYNTWTLLDIDGNSYGIWYDIDGGLLLRLETYGAPLVCEGNSRNITPLKAGVLVGPGSNWVDGADWPDEHNLHTPEYTEWRDKEAYVGIKYDFNGRTRYGWIRVEVAADGQSFLVKDYAYNEVFDEPILTGATEQQDLMVDFKADKTFIYETFDVKYTNLTFSALPVTRYFWTFEGGNPATYEGETPGTVTYANAGKYDVTLKVETADTTITQVKKAYITVEPIMLKAEYVASVTNLVEGGKVRFADASAGSFDIVKWEWTFEGGQPASFEGQNPGEVTYATSGAYEVILKVTDIQGSTHTRFATPGITVFPADYKDYCPVQVTPPTENNFCFIENVVVGKLNNTSTSDNYTDYSRSVQFAGQKGEVVSFAVDLSNENQGARVMAWIDWNGNGEFEDTEIVTNYLSKDKPKNVTFTVPEDAVEGIVGMRVRNKISDQVLNPCEDEGYYGEVEDYAFVISSPAPAGDIFADKQNIKKGEFVTFRANINEITGEGVEAYHWIFEGALPAVSDQRVPDIVQYMEEGAHDVVLELTLQGGEKKVVTKKNFIVVNPAVTLARFSASAMDVPKGGKVLFTDASESSAGITSWEWTFEGGNPASYNGQTPPEITYAQRGDYEVVLTVTDANGQKYTCIEPLFIRVYENGNTYCNIAERGSYYSIVKVAVGEQQHVTPEEPEFYVNDFTDVAFVLEKGKALPFEIELSGNGKDSPARIMAWVDWNQNGVFDEDTECVAKYQDKDKPVDLKIAVPADAKEGATRMRMRTDYYGYLAPCDPMGGMGELEDYTIIVKKDRPAGYIVADNTNPAVGEEVHFTAFVNQITDANVTGYKWTFDGGTPAQSTDRKPAAVTYAAEGVYDVALELTLESGVKKNIRMYDFITAGTKAPEVAVDFIASPVEIFEGAAVDYSVSVSGNGTVTAYDWAFEGGIPATATTQNPTVTYATSGNYDVTLTVTLDDRTQRTVKKSSYITVNPFLLKADFTASATKVNSGTDVVFTNTSIGAESYSWDFGDNTALSADENPTHAFANAGTYTVKLTVTAGTETHVKEMPIVVSAMKAADCTPTGDLTDYCTLTKVQFGEVSYEGERNRFYTDHTSGEPFVMEKGAQVAYVLQAKNPGWPIGIYVWVDWNNDGSFDNTTERLLAFRSDKVTDPATGNINVPADASEGVLRMRVATDYYNENIAGNPLKACGGAMAVEEYAVRIGAAGQEEIVMSVKSDKTMIRENETVTLSVDGAPEGSAYEWTLSGAETITSTEASPVVQYTAAGAYNVKVKVTPNGGTAKTLEESRFIIVNLAKVSADFTVDKTLCALGEEVHFTSASTASAEIGSLEWTFEGGTPATSTEVRPTVTYAVAGKYTVTLKVTDQFGKTDTKIMPEMIEAKEFIKADFTASALTVAVGEPVVFTNRSVAAVSYNWTFDNGEPAVSTETNPTVSFQVAGAAMVTLVAEDIDGKRSVKSEILEVTPRAFGAIQLGDLVQDYDGTVKAVSYTATPAALENDVRIVYKQNGAEVSPKDAGVYEVTASYVGTVPYAVEEVHAQLEIRKQSVQIVASNLRQTYNGEVLKADISTLPEGLKDRVNVVYLQNGEPVEPRKSGAYQLTATLDDPNYEAPVLEEEFAIRKLTGTVSIQLEKEYRYDGTPKFVQEVTTVPEGLNIVVTYNGKTEGAVEAGDYAVVARIQDDNYEGIDEAVLTVKAATPEVSILQDRFVFDGTHHELLYEIQPAGLDCEINYAKEGETVYEVVNSGVYEYTIRISGENYSTVYSGRMQVQKADGQIKITGLRAVYDGEKKEVKIETQPAGLPVRITYDGFEQLPYMPGTYRVFAELDADNYQGQKTAVFGIVKNPSDMKIMNLVVADGTRDCIFRVPELQNIDKSLVMYNEQGTVVFEAKSYYDDFDMRNLPAGTYYYILSYTENGQLQTIRNFVEVIRK